MRSRRDHKSSREGATNLELKLPKQHQSTERLRKKKLVEKKEGRRDGK